MIVNDQVSRKAYLDFLSRNGHCHFQQSPEWAQVKSSWKNEVLMAADEDGRITGAMSILIRKIPLFGNLMYCPRGPVCDCYDRDTLAQLTDGARAPALRETATAYTAIKRALAAGIPRSSGRSVSPSRPCAIGPAAWPSGYAGAEDRPSPVFSGRSAVPGRRSPPAHASGPFISYRAHRPFNSRSGS